MDYEETSGLKVYLDDWKGVDSRPKIIVNHLIRLIKVQKLFDILFRRSGQVD